MPKKRGVEVPKKQAFFVYFSHEINFQTYERGQDFSLEIVKKIAHFQGFRDN